MEIILKGEEPAQVEREKHRKKNFKMKKLWLSLRDKKISKENLHIQNNQSWKL